MRISPDEFCKEFFREYFNGTMTTDDLASRYGFPHTLTMELINHGRFLHDSEAECNKRKTANNGE